MAEASGPVQAGAARHEEASLPDILHDLTIRAPAERVFEAVTSPTGLDAWWTLKAEGTPGPGEQYRLGFGPGYDWAGEVRIWEPSQAVEWEITEADADWVGTRVGFRLRSVGPDTGVSFSHSGWREANSHFRGSSYCWAIYLRLLRRHVESGEVVPYGSRLGA